MKEAHWAELVTLSSRKDKISSIPITKIHLLDMLYIHWFIIMNFKETSGDLCTIISSFNKIITLKLLVFW